MALVIVGMVYMTAAVSTALGLKAPTHLGNRTTQALDHRAQHMVRQHQEMIFFDLQRHVTITYVIRNARKLRNTRTPDFMQRLVRRDDLDNASILQGELVAMRQHGAYPELNPDILPVSHTNTQARFFALIKSQFYRFNCQNLARNKVNRYLHNWFDVLVVAQDKGLEEKVTLRHRQDSSRFADEPLPVCAHLIGFGVDLHVRHVPV